MRPPLPRPTLSVVMDVTEKVQDLVADAAQ
jgi:hypothetical protein